MKVVVFGGSGFLGSHVCDALSASGHDVVIFDLVESIWRHPEQTYIRGNILDLEAVRVAVQSAGAVYNFAGIAELDFALQRPFEVAQANILGNLNIMEASRDAAVERYVYASTVYVYSREGGFYRCSKHACELFIEEYQRTYGLNYSILRYGSLYGPRSNQTNGVYRIVRRALEEGKILYEGHPDALREYIHVEDAARSSVEMLKPEYKNAHVMLTGHKPMRVYDFLHMLGEMMGIEDSVRFIENHHVGHYVRTPYSYNPKIGLKYSPPFHVDLGQGLLNLVEEVDHEIRLRTEKAPFLKSL
jgi:UDP-glucose 4-epimerase